MTLPTNLLEPTTILDLKAILCDREYLVEEIPSKEGIRVTTPKGWIISIQWGPLNYCNTRFSKDPDISELTNAEIAIWTTSKFELIKFEGWTDYVKGWVSVLEILRIIDYLEM